jgi:hypothetical protein
MPDRKAGLEPPFPREIAFDLFLFAGQQEVVAIDNLGDLAVEIGRCSCGCSDQRRAGDCDGVGRVGEIVGAVDIEAPVIRLGSQPKDAKAGRGRNAADRAPGIAAIILVEISVLPRIVVGGGVGSPSLRTPGRPWRCLAGGEVVSLKTAKPALCVRPVSSPVGSEKFCDDAAAKAAVFRPLSPAVTSVGLLVPPVALLLLPLASVQVVIEEPLEPLRSSPLSHVLSFEPRSDGSHRRVAPTGAGDLR